MPRDLVPEPEGYREPWTRQIGEPSKAFSLFSKYRDLGARRSLKAACQIFYGADYGPAKLRYCQEWSRHWDWVKRAEAWDAYLDREARIAQAESVKEMNKRHATIAKAALGKVILALQGIKQGELDAQDIRSLGDWATKLERLCMGEVTDHTKQDVKTEGSVTMEIVEKIVVVGASQQAAPPPAAPALPAPTGAAAANPQDLLSYSAAPGGAAGAVGADDYSEIEIDINEMHLDLPDSPPPNLA